MTELRSSKTDLSLAETRRIALAAQGFGDARPKRSNLTHIRNVLTRLAVLQIDYVNVLTPAHFLVPFSRLGPYDVSKLHELIYDRREFAEQWAHEASILPMRCWPMLRYRMATHKVRPWGFEKFIAEHPKYMRMVLDTVTEKGPVTVDDIPMPSGIPKYIPGAWSKRIPRAALESYFGAGIVAVANRLPNFARVYDLAERVIPREYQQEDTDHEEGRRSLLRIAARAHGIGTAADLADYHRMNIGDARSALDDLAHAGELQVVRVQGWKDAAYLHPEASLPRQVSARAMLSPFDPLVWHRPRAERLFDFEYRIEIYVPAPKRKWGYYVLPFLLGDRIVARVDLKADRQARCLVVQTSHLEPHADVKNVASNLAAELRVLADWLGLETIKVGRRGGLARPLSQAVRTQVV